MEGSATWNSRWHAGMPVFTSLSHRHPAIAQGVSDTKLSLHPEIAKLSTGVKEGPDLVVLAQGMTLRIAGIITPKHPNLRGPQRVEKIGGVGGDENLGGRRRGPAFFPQHEQ